MYLVCVAEEGGKNCACMHVYRHKIERLSLLEQVIFEIVLVSPQVRGLKEGRTEVKIKMRHLVTDHIWIWSRNKFLDRKDHMQDMYQNYVEGEEWQLPQVSHMPVT